MHGPNYNLHYPGNFTGIRERHIQCGGALGEAGHGEKRSGVDYHKTRARRELGIANGECVSGRCRELGGIVGEAVLRLGDTDRQVPVAAFSQIRQAVSRGGQELDRLCPIDFFGDSLDLLAERQAVRVERDKACLLDRKSTV